MIKDDQLTAENLVATVDEIMEDDTLLQQMAAESKKQGIPDAAQRLYQLVQSII